MVDQWKIADNDVSVVEVLGMSLKLVLGRLTCEKQTETGENGTETNGNNWASE